MNIHLHQYQDLFPVVCSVCCDRAVTSLSWRLSNINEGKYTEGEESRVTHINPEDLKKVFWIDQLSSKVKLGSFLQQLGMSGASGRLIELLKE